MHVLPGKAKASIHAVTIGEWQGQTFIFYLSSSCFSILRDPKTIVQSFYQEVDLQGLAFHETTGKIAVYSSLEVFIYAPVDSTRSAITWTYDTTITVDSKSQPINVVSWGTELELLLGGSTLTLWRFDDSQTPKTPKNIWTKALPNAVQFASLAYDGDLIATAGKRDRLVKIWRRQSFDYENSQFDLIYLPHPRAIKSLQWKKPYHREISTENTLYTICMDHVIRVWAPADSHEAHSLQLWALIDLKLELGSPRSLNDVALDDANSQCCVTFLDARVFKLATEAAVSRTQQDQDDTLQRWIEIANKNPDLIFVFDNDGYISAWGMENIGCKSTKTVTTFGIVQRFKLDVKFMSSREDFVQLIAASFQYSRKGLSILAHLHSGDVYIYETNIAELLDSFPRKRSLSLCGIWSGHHEPIRFLVRTGNGKFLLSSSKQTELVLWYPYVLGNEYTLAKKSSIQTSDHEDVKIALIFEDGNSVVTLHSSYIVLWNCTEMIAIEINRSEVLPEKEWLSLFVVPETDEKENMYCIGAGSSDGDAVFWRIRSPGIIGSDTREGYLKQLNHHDTSFNDDVKIAAPIDPVGWSFTSSGTLDTFSREVAITVSTTGHLQSWTALVASEGSDVTWLRTTSVATGISNPSLAKGSSIQKVAILNETRTELTIWDNRSSQLEFSIQFDECDKARDLDWTSTPDSQSILAVGFDHRVLLLAQLRYDYLNESPAWAPIREYSIAHITPHPIGDSTWLCDGTFVIGAGNQFFIHSKDIGNVKDDAFLQQRLHETSAHTTAPTDIFDIVSRLNGPIPVYHPQFLQQYILAGKVAHVKSILVRLYTTLRDDLIFDHFLGLDILDLLNREQDYAVMTDSAHISALDEITDAIDFDEDLVVSLKDKLNQVAVPSITSAEQILLASIVDCVWQMEEHRRSVDDNGSRFLLFFKQYSIRGIRDNDDLSVSFRDIVWAFHSNSQEILLDLVSKQYSGKMTWTQARNAGIFMWLKDLDTIRRQFELVARNVYVSNEDKDPVGCSLYYLALKKKAVLTGLWRMAIGNKEQGATSKFLANDFKEKRWQIAAMKNAYALMGKQRFEYAAAFFLLADSLKDAVNVCFTQLKDIQLAIAVARVYEGDNGPVLQDLLNNKILPLAVQQGNKWLATWAFWMLDKKDAAVRTLIAPIESLVMPKDKSVQEGKYFLTNDPALAVIYFELRDKSLQTLRGALKIPAGEEWRFVMHTARLYDRMGCDVLAMDLVRNWSFPRPVSDMYNPLISHDPRRMTRRRSSYAIVDDVKDDVQVAKPVRTGLSKPPPAVFEEPNMDSFAHFDF